MRNYSQKTTLSSRRILYEKHKNKKGQSDLSQNCSWNKEDQYKAEGYAWRYSPVKVKIMTGNVYTVAAVKDELSNVFLTPIFVKNISEAQRTFAWQINNTPIWKDNPSDFSLWRLGFFDEELGSLTCDPEKICNGRSVRKDNE